MMLADDALKIVAALGVGSTTSAVVTAVIASKSQKGKSRAEAADLLIGAAERVGKMNHDQDLEIKELKLKLDRIQVAMFRYLSGDISREELLDFVRGKNDNT